MWPTILTLHKFLSAPEIERIQAVSTASPFIDGQVSTTGSDVSNKNNLELAPDEGYAEIVKIVDRAIRDNAVLNQRIFPRAVTRAIVSKYDEGMAYGEHVDAAVMGFMSQGRAYGPFGQNYVRSDFSMTIFVSDPTQYEGGELSFDSPWGRHTYKLEAGSAVTYPTGLRHSVAPITRGTRLAVVLWIQSMIRDQEVRKLVADLTEVATLLRGQGSNEADRVGDLGITALRLFSEI